MTYFPPMGSIDAASFNDSRFPGIAYATNPATHAVFTDLQKQLNRAAYAQKLTKRLALDGKIGADTVALANVVKPTPMFDYSTVRNLPLNADIVAAAAKAIADGAGVPQNVPSPIPTSAPKILDVNSGQLIKAPPMVGASLVDSVKNLGMPTLLVLGAAVIGAGYYFTKKAK